MGLTMHERKAVSAVMTKRYRKASKKQKGVLLDEFVALTGYNRWYAVAVLRGRQPAPARSARPATRQRMRVYDAAVLPALRQIWMILDCLCGKRLVAVLP